MMAGAGASPYELASDAASRLGIAVGAEELATLASDLDLGDGEMAAVAATFSYPAEKRRLASIETLLRLSRLPRREPKTFEGFDFSRIQGRDAAALGKLPSLADLYAHRNVASVGPGGIGKTHLAQAYGRECCMRGLKTYHIKATELRDRVQVVPPDHARPRRGQAVVGPQALHRQARQRRRHAGRPGPRPHGGRGGGGARPGGRRRPHRLRGGALPRGARGEALGGRRHTRGRARQPRAPRRPRGGGRRMSAVAEASPSIRARDNLSALGLHEMAAALPDYVRMVAAGERDFCSALEEMTRVEVAAREARIVRQRIRSSGFPYVKGLADFDWDFQPGVPRARVEELATLRFIERAENVLLVGSPGVGKTHLAVAIGIEAVRAGREVRFMDCARLVEDLQDAQARGILKKRLKYYAHSKLLVIDELGYLDIGEGGADLLFQLISTRYEQRSTIITTNVGIGGWGKVFGDDVAASAIADRVCHHCHVIKITGRSYRLKDLPRERRGGD